MVNFDQSFANYLVYVSAFNGKIWTNHTEVGYLAKFTVIDSLLELPQVAPFFEESLVATINLTTSAFSNETIKYQLPNVLDFNIRDTQVVSVKKLENFIVFVQSTKTFLFDQSKLTKDDIGSFSFDFWLVDNKQKKNRYELEVKIEEPFIPKYDFGNLTGNWTPEYKDPYTNCSASIDSINRYGKIKIKFFEFKNVTGEEPAEEQEEKVRKLLGAGNFNRFSEI